MTILSGTRVIEFAGLAPAPFAGMLLADYGADVVRVDRVDEASSPGGSIGGAVGRGKRSIALDLKAAAGLETALRLVDGADVLIEPWRPGVAERLGLGPDTCLERNPGLIYGRMTGYGQDGPYASRPGHDINYIALAGALDSLGREGQPPTPPINLLGDFAGGGLLLATGILAALLERTASGRGQVIDAAMVDGAALLTTWLRPAPGWAGMVNGARGTGLFDTGAPFYEVYETSDGKWISIGSYEPQFYAALLARLGLGQSELPPQLDRSSWPAMKARFAEIFKTRTRDEWCEILESDDVCFAPVLSAEEAPFHPHNVARGTYVDYEGTATPSPAPRFSRTPGRVRGPSPRPGQHTDRVLAEAGYEPGEIARLRDLGVIT